MKTIFQVSNRQAILRRKNIVPVKWKWTCSFLISRQQRQEDPVAVWFVISEDGKSVSCWYCCAHRCTFIALAHPGYHFLWKLLKKEIRGAKAAASHQRNSEKMSLRCAHSLYPPTPCWGSPRPPSPWYWFLDLEAAQQNASLLDLQENMHGKLTTPSNSVRLRKDLVSLQFSVIYSWHKDMMSLLQMNLRIKWDHEFRALPVPSYFHSLLGVKLPGN